MHGTESPSLFVDLNVLPEELRPHRLRLWLVLGTVVVLGAVLGLLQLSDAERSARDETPRLELRLERLGDDLREIQHDLVTVRELREELEATAATTIALAKERRAMIGERQELSERLAAVARHLPPGASLGAVAGSAGAARQMTLTGRARNPRDVLAYAEVLRSSGGFAGARVASLAVANTDESDPGVKFTIEAAW